MYRWSWDVGGEKDKDKKKEVRETWHTSGMNEKREEKKKHTHTQLFPKSKIFSCSPKETIYFWAMSMTKVSSVYNQNENQTK